MTEKNTMERYAEYINKNIMPFIDYDKLQESYKTDMVYAKGILSLLHKAMVKVYGGEHFSRDAGDDGFVLIPGVLQSKNNGNICLALLEIDCHSGGEFWSAHYICKSGVVSQADERQPQLLQLLNKLYTPCDYCYTAVIPYDHHVDIDRLTKDIKQILNSFRKYEAVLTGAPEKNGNKPSLLGGMRDAEKEIKRKTRVNPKKIITEPEQLKTGYFNGRD